MTNILEETEEALEHTTKGNIDLLEDDAIVNEVRKNSTDHEKSNIKGLGGGASNMPIELPDPTTSKGRTKIAEKKKIAPNT